MHTIKRIFRNTYQGENIYTSATYVAGEWQYQTEHVPKIVHNQRYSKNAVAIGNGVSRENFDLNIIKHKKIQTYGCNALYRDFSPTFLLVTGSDIAQEVYKSGYAAKNVVYSTTDNILKYPSMFHLVPQNPAWNSGALAAYLACFDGHSTVYLVGHDGLDTEGHFNNIYKDTNAYTDYAHVTDKFWALSMSHVFKTYPLVEFVLVNATGRGYMPVEWLGHTNLRRISFYDMVLECDL